jgi:plastocyanin
MTRIQLALLCGSAVTIAVAGAAAAPADFPGVPDDLAQYRSWTKMNVILMNDPSNPRAGPKNTFTNLSADTLRGLVAPGARLRAPFPDGAIFVRETLDTDTGFVRILFIMTKDRKATQTRGWRFSAFTRTAANQTFQPLEIADPVARCMNCHAQVKSYDLLFQPFTNRADRLPARIPAGPARVEIFNFIFGPQTLRVRAGTTVVFVNHDAVPHDVKANDRSFESGNLPQLGRYFQLFERPGTVDYFCAVHLEMRARIIVEP